ncbi:hypothetical protein CEXT_580241 [Caerostris extrusa]|uniref:Uncharacterized protein n=1 Tax=Caerostris extrusa TaxID=172846 RepID=A0AAV4SNZ3_CAEEX|nr:hypothetical protein CEXT_580241 [Caerostris extrusa]
MDKNFFSWISQSDSLSGVLTSSLSLVAVSDLCNATSDLKCQNILPVRRRIFPAYHLTGVEGVEKYILFLRKVISFRFSADGARRSQISEIEKSQPPAFSRYRTRCQKAEKERQRKNAAVSSSQALSDLCNATSDLKCLKSLPIGRRIFPAYHLTGDGVSFVRLLSTIKVRSFYRVVKLGIVGKI